MIVKYIIYNHPFSMLFCQFDWIISEQIERLMQLIAVREKDCSSSVNTNCRNSWMIFVLIMKYIMIAKYIISNHPFSMLFRQFDWIISEQIEWLMWYWRRVSCSSCGRFRNTLFWRCALKIKDGLKIHLNSFKFSEPENSRCKWIELVIVLCWFLFHTFFC